MCVCSFLAYILYTILKYIGISIISNHINILIYLGEFTLNVTNCRDVFITRNAFHNTTFNAVFDDIGHLGLFEGAFADSRDSKV